VTTRDKYIYSTQRELYQVIPIAEHVTLIRSLIYRFFNELTAITVDFQEL
jgi:hypothetical protein